MSNQDRLKTLLLHIKSYCEEINKTFDFFGKDFGTFSKNEIFRNAISMPVFQICELVKTINRDFSKFTDENTDIPWKSIIKMRERFAHHYFGMDYEIIFNTAISDIPMLYTFIKNYLKNK